MALGQHRAVTLLFTDIVGSTGLWAAYEREMIGVLERHDGIVRDCVLAANGRVFKHTGDGAAAVFDDPAEALAVAAAIQCAVGAVEWGLPEPLRVRAAVHAGVVHERDGDLFGPPLNRAARLVDRCAPGGVLVSDAVASLVAQRTPEGLELVSLGSVQLRGLQQPEVVHAVAGLGLVTEGHSVGPERSAIGRLPVTDEELVGRLDELRTVSAAVELSPLVTVVGVGGMGKTRLALEVATLASDRFVDGVWWCDLTAATHGDSVPAVVLETLGGRLSAGRTTTQSVTEMLMRRRSLVVLDNCEHVLDAVHRLVNEVRAGCADVHVLMTSREAVGLRGERLVALSSLPDEDGLALFFERGSEVRPGLERDNDTEAAARAICARLDGIPLAIELAAARCRSMSPSEIAARLDDRFKLLRGGRGTVDRHRTLQATVAWSHSMLDDDEREIFERMSVFAGGALLDAIAGVVGVDEYEALDIVDRLVARSLVVVTDTHLGSRYSMLETLRQFGEDQLVERGMAEEVRDAHLAWVVSLAHDARSSWATASESKYVRRHVAEIDNIRAAVVHANASRRIDDVTNVITGFGETAIYWGSYDALNWADANVFDPARSADHADAIAFLCQLALFAGDAPRATEYLGLLDGIPDREASVDIIAARNYHALWIERNAQHAHEVLDRWDVQNAATGDCPIRTEVARAWFTTNILLQPFASPTPEQLAEARELTANALDRIRAEGCDVWTVILLNLTTNIAIVTGQAVEARSVASEALLIAQALPEAALQYEATIAAYVAMLAESDHETGSLEAARTIRSPLAGAISRGSWFGAIVIVQAALALFATRPEFDALALASIAGGDTFEGLETRETIVDLVGRQRTDALVARASNMTVAEAAQQALAALDHLIEAEPSSEQLWE